MFMPKRRCFAHGSRLFPALLVQRLFPVPGSVLSQAQLSKPLHRLAFSTHSAQSRLVCSGPFQPPSAKAQGPMPLLARPSSHRQAKGRTSPLPLSAVSLAREDYVVCAKNAAVISAGPSLVVDRQTALSAVSEVKQPCCLDASYLKSATSFSVRQNGDFNCLPCLPTHMRLIFLRQSVDI